MKGDWRKVAFTLVELLVVVAIIGILAALLLPGLKMARDMAKSISCLNHQRQISLAMACYLNDFNDCYPDATPSYNNWWRWSHPDVVGRYWGRTGHSFSVDDNTGILYCPAAPAKGNGDQDGVMAVNVDVVKENANERVQKVKYPSRTVLLVDGMQWRWHGGQSGGGYAGTYESLKGTGVLTYSWSAVPSLWCYAIRHSGGCNASFVDGHGTHVRDMKDEHLKGRLTYRQNGADL